MDAEAAGWGEERTVRGMQAQAVKESHTGKKKLQNQEGRKEKGTRRNYYTCPRKAWREPSELSFCLGVQRLAVGPLARSAPSPALFLGFILIQGLTQLSMLALNSVSNPGRP